MGILTFVLVAYFLSGISYVIKASGQNVTLVKAIVIVLTWPSRAILAHYSPGHVARAVVFGLCGAFIQMTILTTITWAAYTIAGMIFDAFIFKLLLAVVIAYISLIFVLPLYSILSTLVVLLVAPIIGLFVSQTSELPANPLRWCKRCKHFRKIKDYERSLWREESTPRSDNIPCKIALETSGVWAKYYGTEWKHRATYPKDCPQFESK